MLMNIIFSQASLDLHSSHYQIPSSIRPSPKVPCIVLQQKDKKGIRHKSSTICCASLKYIILSIIFVNEPPYNNIAYTSNKTKNSCLAKWQQSALEDSMR